jgi:predicted ATP-dependent endonuclease of OLD family
VVEQGEHRFEADADHFRIWVSDDQRPVEVELEGRSTGLQWFLSFYLVFLVGRRDTHAGAILLLDEPGTSLHPLAQKDLSAFFDGLSRRNQRVYTTHSPFVID